MTADASLEAHRLEITTRHLVRDILAGEYLSIFRGRGVEFAEVREYQPGDDIRLIDWNVTARTGTAYIKHFVEERALTVAFVLDLSASGDFGSRMRTKRRLAVELCAVLAFAAARNHDRVGALTFTDRVERFVPPAQGRRHALRLVNDLIVAEPAGRGTDLAGALEQLDLLLRRRSVVFIVSDFAAAGYEEAVGRLGRRHDVTALQVYDRRERTLPDAGLMSLYEPETETWHAVDSSNAAVRAEFARRTAAFDVRTRNVFRERGVDLVPFDAGEPYAETLITYFRQRERRRWR